ncbi:MAG: hypothetical protein ACTSRP_00640 [Candidatus Helarchaeota archaeon]
MNKLKPKNHKTLKKIMRIEDKLERINSFINFDNLKKQGYIPKNVMEIIDNLDYFKNKLKSDKLNEREVKMLNIVLDEINFYFDYKFSDYV